MVPAEEQALGHLVEPAAHRQLGQHGDVGEDERADAAGLAQRVGADDTEHRVPLDPMSQQLRQPFDRVVGAEVEIVVVEGPDLAAVGVDEEGPREGQHDVRRGIEHVDAPCAGTTARTHRRRRPT